MTRPHVIVQNFNVLQIIMYGVRRGKEGIADLKVGDFAVKEDEIWGLKTFAKVGKAAVYFLHGPEPEPRRGPSQESWHYLGHKYLNIINYVIEN